MKKEQTEKSRYPSIYSPGKYVTFAQYIAELMCGRKGRSEGVDLPAQFWDSSKKWCDYFKMQLICANQLTAKYSERVIMTALKEMPHAFSFRLKALLDKIEEVSRRSAPVQPCDVKPAEQPSKGRFNRKNKLDKLDE